MLNTEMSTLFRKSFAMNHDKDRRHVEIESLLGNLEFLAFTYM